MTASENPLEMNFCRRCGSPLKFVRTQTYECAKGHTIHINRIPCSGVFFVTNDNKLLMSVRGIEPHKGTLDAFGGFVGMDETFEEGAVRELREEVSLEPGDYETLEYLCSATEKYPFKGEVMPLIMMLFWSRLKLDELPAPSDDVAGIKSFPLNDVDFSNFHADSIRSGVRELHKRLLP